MKKVVYNFLLIILISQGAKAQFVQSEEEKLSTWSLHITPTSAMVNCFQIDLEKRFAGNSQGLVFSPRFYLKSNVKNNDVYYDFNDTYLRMMGTGIDVYHRMYISPDLIKFGFFVGYGVTYRYHSIDYDSYDWSDYDYDEYNTIVYASERKNAGINRFGGGFQAGIYFSPVKKLFLEGHIGSTFIYSMPQNEEVRDRVNDEIIGYGYSGIMPKIALKVGFRL